MSKLLFILTFAGWSSYGMAQCTNSWAWGSATAPSTVGSTATMSTCNYQDEYSSASNIVAGSVYTVDYSLGGCITVHSGSAGGPVVAYGNAPLTFTATVSGTYYFHYNTDCSCNTDTECGVSTITLVSAGGGGGGCLGGSNNTCSTADPFCTGTSYNYCNSTSVASAGTYDCLTTTPNPMWMYLNIATSGSIDIQINQYTTAGVGIDVDFALYGPYTDLTSGCNNIDGSTPTVDCSYSTAYTENASIPSASAGEWYILLITNYDGDAGYIQFAQTGGTGATDCNIVLPVDLVSFEVKGTSAGNLLIWKCASEVNNNAFFVQRSVNATDFESLAAVPGAGTSSALTAYSFLDADFIPNTINYYRLGQVDFNGNSSYSDIVHIDTRNDQGPRVIRRVDLMGQEIDPLTFRGMYIEFLSDGTVRKSCCEVVRN